jgi:putative SOS response-associated peptidase YedK
MCGRYTQTADIATLQRRFGFADSLIALKPRYNIAPSQDAPVVVAEKGARALRLYRWGLVPSWAKDPAIGHKMINARAETAAVKPSFKRPLERSRCLVAADGFYEWRKEAGIVKTPMRIVLKSREPFAMAGLWDAWKSPEGKTVETFAILTTEANALMRPIHDRMPVILRKEDEALWLDPAARAQDVAALLAPIADNALEAYEVSRLVNSPANDTPAVAMAEPKK